MKFEVNYPDLELSPYTGMTKKHWIDACYFLLEGIFSNVTDIDKPIRCPRTEFVISYPNKHTAPWKEYAAKFEGLDRSFLIAAPLLYNEPQAEVCGYSMAEYYKRHILFAVTKESPDYMLDLNDVKKNAFPNESAFQHTCECASLVIGLDQCKAVIWDTYSKEEKDRIANYLMEFGVSKTIAHNWRLFNMLILGFLWKEGYSVNEDMIRDHAQVILSYYAGDGWYRDGHRFDYYSPWAFQVYGPIWNSWYGYEKEPYIAKKIEEYANEMMQVYHSMFDKEGKVTMWARSGIYRNAATAPFASIFLLKNHNINPGLARRIHSGALLQFLTCESVFENGVPTLGFYGGFPPILQDYSCAESPFWIANSFVSLCLPDEHPFWTERENNGDWDTLSKKTSKICIMNGAGIVTYQHGGNGSTEFCTAKNVFEPEDSYIKAYIRKAFHSQYPWEDFDYKGAEAMQYSIRFREEEKAQVPNIILYGGVKNGVLYRNEYFNFQYNFQGTACMQLADFPVYNGLIHVDKMRIHEKPFCLTLGAYGFPVEGNICIERKEKDGIAALVVKNKVRQLAFVNYGGFEELKWKKRKGVNAIAEESILMYGVCKREEYYEYKPYILISAILSKNGTEDFSEEELYPIERIEYTDLQKCGGYGPIQFYLKDGRTMMVDYEKMEGNMML